MKMTTRPSLFHSPKQREPSRRQRPGRNMAGALLLLSAAVVACHFSTSSIKSTGMPPAAQAAIDAFSADVAAERYEKIYKEVADEWRKRATVEQMKEFFAKLRERLGSVKTRTSQTIRDQESVGGEIPGHSLMIIYETAFERAAGMETFTLVERDGRWLLAGYFVNSSALKE
jgi:hypothetical protein